MPTKTAKRLSAEELARMHFDYFNHHNLAEGAKHVTPDYEWTTVPFGETFRGPQGYMASGQGWIDAFPDAKCEITRVIATETMAVVEFHGKGTHKGTLTGPQGKIPATGKKLDMPCIEVYEFKNDKLNRGRTYFDSATLMRQLGVTR